MHGKGEPFKLLVECGEREEVGIVVRVGFHSHYGEPPLDLPLTVHRGIGEDMGGILPWQQVWIHLVWHFVSSWQCGCLHGVQPLHTRMGSYPV